MRGRGTIGVLVGAALLAGCAAPIEDVRLLFEEAGGVDWCGTDLTVTIEPWVGSCGDPTGDGRVVLGISYGGDEIRTSIDVARDGLTEDGQLLLVTSDPDRPVGFQLRSRDRAKLEAARDRLGGTVLDSEEAIDAWLAG